MSRAGLGAACSSLALLAGCAMDEEPRPAHGWERRVTYACDRGPGITVVYTEGWARIEGSDGRVIEMKERPAASGTWYESATHSIRGKGDEVTYTIGRMVPMTCRAEGPTPR